MTFDYEEFEVTSADYLCLTCGAECWIGQDHKCKVDEQ
jgi:hypothetical protein